MKKIIAWLFNLPLFPVCNKFVEIDKCDKSTDKVTLFKCKMKIIRLILALARTPYNLMKKEICDIHSVVLKDTIDKKGKYCPDCFTERYTHYKRIR